MARRILHQYSNRAFDNLNLTPARSGELRHGRPGARLVGRNFGCVRFGRARLWIDRIFATWFRRSISPVGARGRSGSSRPLPDNRGASVQSDVAARPIPLSDVYRSESSHVCALCRARWDALLPAAKSDSSSALLSDRGRSGTAALHPDHFLPFALVGRTRCELWTKASARCRSVDCRFWLRAFYDAGHERQLLDNLFSADGAAWFRHGGERRAAYHHGN